MFKPSQVKFGKSQIDAIMYIYLVYRFIKLLFISINTARKVHLYAKKVRDEDKIVGYSTPSS